MDADLVLAAVLRFFHLIFKLAVSTASEVLRRNVQGRRAETEDCAYV